MKDSILDRTSVLVVNRNWFALRPTTVREALVAMHSGDNYTRAATAVDVRYHQNTDGSWDFSNADLMPTPLKDWLQLEIRSCDEAVYTAKQAVRAPTVIIAVNYAKMPRNARKLTYKAIRDRDGNRCQVSGRLLRDGEGNIDHVDPRARGGIDSWENLVYMDRKLNAFKADKSLEELGWKLIKEPKAPLPVPACANIRQVGHSDWRFFIEYQ